MEQVRRIRVGNGMDEQVTMGPVVSKGQFETVQRYIHIGKQEGRLLIGGGASDDVAGILSQLYLILFLIAPLLRRKKYLALSYRL